MENTRTLSAVTAVPGSEPSVVDDAQPSPVRSRCGPDEAIACLLSVTQELNASADLASGLARVAERVREYVEYDTFAVLLLDERGKELRFEFASGFPPGVTEHWRFGMGQGIVGTAAETRQPLLVADAQKDPRYINACEDVRSELAIPLLVKGRTIGVLDLGSAQPGYFTADDQRLLSFLSDYLAGAVESARLYQNMREQGQTLSLLHEVSRELTSILDRKRLLERVAELVRRLIDYDVFTVMMWNEETRLLEPSLSVYKDGPRVQTARSVALGQGITGTAAALRQPLRVPNVDLDPRYVPCATDVEVHSELVVPLIFEDRLLGVLDLESSEYDAFSSQHEQLLSTLAASLAISLENARLYERLLEDERRLEKDLTTARELQKQLLPKTTPWIPGLQLALAAEPAKHLGGDFHDFLHYGKKRVAIAVGDVAGKATSAALYGALALGTLREFAVQDCLDPAGTLSNMNNKLHRLGIDNRFVAMTFGVYDRTTRKLLLANSGLPHPYLLRNGEPRKIEAGGVPLGMLADRSYEQVELELFPGDAVVIASDGIDESSNREDEQFGAERVAITLRRLAAGSAQEIADGLLKAVRAHSGTGEPSDDRTVVVLKAIPETAEG